MALLQAMRYHIRRALSGRALPGPDCDAEMLAEDEALERTLQALEVRASNAERRLLNLEPAIQAGTLVGEILDGYGKLFEVLERRVVASAEMITAAIKKIERLEEKAAEALALAKRLEEQVGRLSAFANNQQRRGQ